MTVLFCSLFGVPRAKAESVSADYPGKPFNGTPLVIPGVIRVTQYDIAPDTKPEITFHYGGNVAKTNFRPGNDSIGIGAFDSSHFTTDGKPMPVEGGYLGWTQSGEWTKYTVTVTEAATYIVGGQFAAAGADSKISITFSPTLTTGLLPVPTTDGFQPGKEVYHVWETLDHMTEITLPAGTCVMTLKLDNAAGLNVNSISFTKKK